LAKPAVPRNSSVCYGGDGGLGAPCRAKASSSASTTQRAFGPPRGTTVVTAREKWSMATSTQIALLRGVQPAVECRPRDQEVLGHPVTGDAVVGHVPEDPQPLLTSRLRAQYHGSHHQGRGCSDYLHRGTLQKKERHPKVPLKGFLWQNDLRLWASPETAQRCLIAP